MSGGETTDSVWEELYGKGHAVRYPWDVVVSFVFRNVPESGQRRDVRILEVGFGTASNLWFAAREGFQVCGLEGSASAVEFAKKRFKEEDLEGDLRCGEFPELPFEDESVDLAFDRAAITCVPFTVAAETIREVRRVLRPSGRFLLNTYSSEHDSCRSGRLVADGRTIGISGGTLIGVGGICFFSEQQMRQVIGSGWKILEFGHLVIADSTREDGVHAEWRVVLEKAQEAS